MLGVQDIRFADDRPERTPAGLCVQHPNDVDPNTFDAVHVAIGHNHQRRTVAESYLAAGRTLLTLIHPAAFVSPSASVADGVFVGPGAVVHTGANLGLGAIINSNATVEHHARIADFAHIGPAAALCGQAAIGANTLVGLGARVMHCTTVGEDATVGAGAVVTKDVSAGATVVGIPAKPLGG